MFLTHLSAASNWFEVLHTSDRSQSAVMNLDPGKSSGDEPESHSGSDQILVVLEGEVMGSVGEETARLKRGDVVIIPSGVPHRFENVGSEVARTLSVYAPPVFPAGMRESVGAG
ncbi:MAG TPA: cupin domain-containing protein [Chthoniobacteraceae bacterium]|jgi:mannose-6-phosphate isomerase-like protein (cupin superfamily)